MNLIIRLILLTSIVNAFYFPQFQTVRKSSAIHSIVRTSNKGRTFYPLSRIYHEEYLKRLQSNNITTPTHRQDVQRKFHYTEDDEDDPDLEEDDDFEMDEEEQAVFEKLLNSSSNNNSKKEKDRSKGGFRIIIDPALLNMNNDDESGEEKDVWGKPIRSTLTNRNRKSQNFEVITAPSFNFSSVGGYDSIKQELEQCVDLLTHYEKYAGYNVRVPKGLVFEGPPGNGKTLLAKALAGEAKTGFIPVSGSQFQDKYVGVGSSRIRELFDLAKRNVPCIVFIDEIDALGRKRSGDGETSGSERDNTLNELLVALDGFKNTSGVFIVGATNRPDLLDDALLRPGRIDKRIYIGNPDKKTRKAIVDIHIKGKPYDSSIVLEEIVDNTNGLSGAQLENLLNEAMLNALRYNRKEFNDVDIDFVMNKMMVGWQPNEHQFTTDIIDHIAVHELGHAIAGLVSKHHSKMTKVVINLSAPKSPAYTIFESSSSNILTREALLEHLMILLSGRIAEEVVYGVSVTTGAINDFEEALKLAERMICYYGMGKQPIYPSMSEKYKEKIDCEVSKLINDAYAYGEFLIRNSKDLLIEGANQLKKQKVMKAEELLELMNTKYSAIFQFTPFK